MPHKLVTFISEIIGKETVYHIVANNGVSLGDILAKEDGFYDWWPPFPSNGGCWPSYVIREIADKLDELNAPWEKQIEEYFANSSTK